MTYIIHHVADNDGIFSAAIIKSNLPEQQNVTLVPHQYGWDCKKIHAIPSGSLVYMVDISLPKIEMVALAARCSLVWLDHHKSAIEEISGAPGAERLEGIIPIECNGQVATFRADCEVGMAGIELAWRQFRKPEDMKKNTVLCLLAEYDVFRTKESSPLTWENFVLPVNVYCSQEVAEDVDKAMQIVDDAEILGIREMCMVGRAIIKQRLKNSADTMRFGAFVAEFHGAKFLVVNQRGVKTSDYEIVFDPSLHEAALCYYFDGETTKVSMRQVVKNNIDLSSIAKTYGGGGHVGAAGFACDYIEFHTNDVGVLEMTPVSK